MGFHCGWMVWDGSARGLHPNGVEQQSPGSPEAHPGNERKKPPANPIGVPQSLEHGSVEPRWGSVEDVAPGCPGRPGVPRVRSATLGFDVPRLQRERINDRFAGRYRRRMEVVFSEESQRICLIHPSSFRLPSALACSPPIPAIEDTRSITARTGREQDDRQPRREPGLLPRRVLPRHEAGPDRRITAQVPVRRCAEISVAFRSAKDDFSGKSFRAHATPRSTHLCRLLGRVKLPRWPLPRLNPAFAGPSEGAYSDDRCSGHHET